MRKPVVFFLAFCSILAVILFLYPTFIEIGVGVTILLFGILNLENGFKIFTEGPLRIILRRSTDHLYKSISVGIVSTAILNSSSLISVLVISFISAGLISLKAGIGVVFGSNIGTTFTGWLVALFGLKMEISRLAMPMIIFGILFILQKSRSLKGWGHVITGLGFFFLGIFFLKTGLDTFQFDLKIFETEDAGPMAVLTYTGIGILATVILQSSSATLAIILTALSVNQITYPDALALAIGSNIGTTFTALLGSLAANEAGKKLAAAHLIFNVITGTIALIFLSQLKWIVDHLAVFLNIPDQNYTLRLALFHTIFNVLGVIIMVPWINRLVKILNRVIRDKPVTIEMPKYLNEKILDHPQSALHALFKETEHLLDNTFEIMAHSLNVHRTELLQAERIGDVLRDSGKSIDIDIQVKYKSNIKTIYSKIFKYASLIATENLTDQEINRLSNIKEANRLIVRVIKDLEILRINLDMFMNSDNVHVRETYNKFRKRLLRIIRELFLNIKKYPYQSNLSLDTPEKQRDKDLDIIKENVKIQRSKIANLDQEITTILKDLLEKDLISSQMATSIWNDCIYVIRIGENLLEIMELLYLGEEEREKKVGTI